MSHITKCATQLTGCYASLQLLDILSNCTDNCLDSYNLIMLHQKPLHEASQLLSSMKAHQWQNLWLWEVLTT